jgi:perosamine synthetase
MYSLLALNYRMNEITAAVGRAQLRKVEGVVRAMNSLGNKLTELIKDVPGILTCPVTPGGEHSYWLYGFKVTGYDAKKFADAVKAEGIPVGWGYTMHPIYLCADALAERKTFGESKYPFVPPFSDQVVEYKAGLCPKAERDLLQLCTLRVYENWTDQDISDIACAIRKVALGLKPNA